MGNTKTLGYVRLSRKEESSWSVKNQLKEIKQYNSAAVIYVDDGVSGKDNLVSDDGAWSDLWKEFLKEPQNSEIVVCHLDRLGRRKGKILSMSEDVFDFGGSILDLSSNMRYDSSDDFSKQVGFTFSALMSDAYRQEIARKSKIAQDSLKDAGLFFGPVPKLSKKDCDEIRDLHERGLGLRSIGKVVRTKNSKGVWVNTGPAVVRKVLDGVYVPREAFLAHNAAVRAGLRGVR